jgi:choline dehydrogenase
VIQMIFSAERQIDAPPPGTWVGQTHLFWKSRSGLPGPDLQPMFVSHPNYDPEWMEGPENGFTMLPGIIRPATRGTLRLRSADPTDELELDPRYLGVEADMQAMLASLELCRELGRSSALAEWGAKELYPGPGVTSDADLREYIRRTIGTYHHQVGTCKMGIDAESVVDPQLRVYGVEGLRVADASIMPAVSSGNTHAPAMMIGEKAADSIIGMG